LEFFEIKKEINKIERHLIGQESERNTLQNILTEQENNLKNLENKKGNTKKAQIFLRQRASDTRLKALASIEEILTSAIQKIYGDDYVFSFEIKEIHSKDDDFSGQFSILPCIEKTINGKRVMRPIKGSNGGGLQEIISVLLRIAFGTYNDYKGIYIFDEALAAVSKDVVMANMLAFLKSYIDELDLQVILISHSADKFSLISSVNYLTFKEDGIAKIKSVSHEEILEMQNFGLEDETVGIP
jgi:DNA repair ATPase RecN